MKKTKLLLLISLICFYLLMIASSCTKQEIEVPMLEINDGGLLSGLPCSAPCFWNISPGITTEKEAVGILSTLGDIDKCDKWDAIENGADKGIGCNNLWITFNEQGLVSRISYTITPPVALEDLIKIYGDPDHISVTAEGIQSEGPLIMLLMYDQEHMVVGFQPQNATNFLLLPNTLIDHIQYCENRIYENIITSMIDTWNGYGKYQ